jgi:hypothetical protein
MSGGGNFLDNSREPALGVEASNYAHFNADDRKPIDALVTEGKSVLTNTRLFAEIQKVGSLKP